MSEPTPPAPLPAPPVNTSAAPSQSSAPVAPPHAAGWRTSEFWLIVALNVATVLGASLDLLPPKWAAFALALSNGIYAVARSAVKMMALYTGSGLDTIEMPSAEGGPDAQRQIRNAVGELVHGLQMTGPAPAATTDRDIEEASKAAAGAPPGLATCLVISLSLALFGCSTMTGDPKKDTRARVTNAVLTDVFNIALQGAISAGAAALQGQNGQDAARAAFESAALPAGVNIIHDVITAYAGPQAAPIAQAADAAIALAKPTTPAEKAAVLNTIGAAIQTAANQAF